ncbi:MAG: nucleoside phosphorylase [Magnetovibrio sp.]|nr:nucleoside phosphorylase [Magnetovibrio sp.]
MNNQTTPPILEAKSHDEDSVFKPENLLREARRQKSLDHGSLPNCCILDPDGDILNWLQMQGMSQRSPHWSCYHTALYEFEFDGHRLGIIGQAVGAPFAVLLAEQLFASSCSLIISMTSAGQISEALKPPCFVLIDKALRDEGTSYHYLAPSTYSLADPGMLALLNGCFDDLNFAVVAGASWTTDAPYRETQTAIDAARAKGVLAVEMEAAALYAFSQAQNKPVLCFAHVTNQMAQNGDDFEKGEADGALDALAVISAAYRALQA